MNKSSFRTLAGIRPWPQVCPLVLFFCIAAVTTSPGHAVDSATVRFAFDFPSSSPEHYSITVQSDGRAHYESSGKISPDSDEKDDYEAKFVVSDSTRTRIFDLAKQANYFSGKLDSGKKKLAFTGEKTLAFDDGQRNTKATYNYSSQPAVQQLTQLFQSIGTTLEFCRRLAYYHRYQKLALDDELKRMEDQARQGEIIELQAAKTMLQQIYDDPSVMNVVRTRALRIIAMSGAGH